MTKEEMKQRFDLSLWLQDKSRKKVVTRNGRPVRIVCEDSPILHHPIVGFVECDLFTWTDDGKVIYGGKCEDKNDLFFADEEEELTEFEKTVQNILNEPHFQDVQAVKQFSKVLLDLAIKEIRKERQEKLGTLEMPIDVTEPYYIKGREDALKDLEINKEPASEDLEEEIERWIKEKHFIFTEIDEIIETAHHFAHWQHGKDFDDLLQSEMKFPKEYYARGKADAIKEMKEALQTEYEKGRFDMRKEMMKNAVLETKVIMDCDGDGIETPYTEWLTLENTEIPYIQNNLGLKEGDRVKIIIVKEEQQ